MKFIDRAEELDRLNRLAGKPESGLAVVFGRRRVGKTRLLLEWVKQQKGAYWVADPSTEKLQRQYLAAAVAKVLPGFRRGGVPGLVWSVGPARSRGGTRGLARATRDRRTALPRGRLPLLAECAPAMDRS
ncbi:MAG: ATP-binding protein [Planctomycetota bacterium]